MKRKEIELIQGNEYIINMGKKFKNTHVLAKFIEKDIEGGLTFKCLKIVDGTKPNAMLLLAFSCLLIIDKSQVIA